MRFLYDKTLSNNKVVLDFGYKFYGCLGIGMAEYKAKDRIIRLYDNDKKIVISDLNGNDLSEKFDFELNYLKENPFDRSVLSILFKKELSNV